MIYAVVLTFHLNVETEHDAFEAAGSLNAQLGGMAQSLVVTPYCPKCDEFHEEEGVELIEPSEKGVH